MRTEVRLLLVFLLGIVTGSFAVVGDEIQNLPWNGLYNYPVLGELPKYGGWLHLGAWDLAFGVVLVAPMLAMLLMMKQVRQEAMTGK